ncbi:unnamed protein product [Effrenium voratum]|nr:unnamed protein product [Effrenium voratum]
MAAECAGQLFPASSVISFPFLLGSFEARWKYFSGADCKSNTKFFEWMTEDEAHRRKVKLKAEGSEEVSGLVMPPVGLNEKDLSDCLQSHNVDLSRFGTNGARSLKEFSRELMSGESFLVIDASGKAMSRW